MQGAGPPSWPVFRAPRSSRTSAPRHSPTTNRSGRIRSASRTSRSSPIAPVPSADACRASSPTTCGCSIRSSAVSSTVTIRSSWGTAPSIAASTVVFPLPVAPVTSTLRRPATASSRTVRRTERNVPSRSSSASVGRSGRGSRMDNAVPPTDTGARTTCTRTPSPCRTSAHGVVSSTCRPPRATSSAASARARRSGSSGRAGSSPRPRSIHVPCPPTTSTSVVVASDTRAASSSNTDGSRSLRRRVRSAPGRNGTAPGPPEPTLGAAWWSARAVSARWRCMRRR